jgi:transaldolase
VKILVVDVGGPHVKCVATDHKSPVKFKSGPKLMRRLHDLGQSLWLDNIARELLTSGALSRSIAEYSVTGLTSNSSIFDHAIKIAGLYDDAIHKQVLAGKSGEQLFFELALEDLTQAADLFRPIHHATGGVDGWVSLELSPLLANFGQSSGLQSAR